MTYYVVEGTAVVGDGERYQFLTKGIAAEFASILNRNEYQTGVTSGYWTATTANIEWAQTMVFKEAGREIMRMNVGGSIDKLDLPYLIWVWLRSTPLVKFMKALWYGQGRTE